MGLCTTVFFSQSLVFGAGASVNKGDSLEEYLLLGIGVGGIYYVSEKPAYLGSMYLLGASLGAQGKNEKETTSGYIALGTGALYNFTLANQASSKEEVFLVNMGIWTTFAVYNAFFNKDVPSKNTSTVTPIFKEKSLGLIYEQKL